jgi:alkylation response protein AidB-like acyl-CoA dehydrogenase
VDFTFSPEQDALRDTARSFLASRSDYFREIVEDDRGFTDEWWSAVLELGWPSILLGSGVGGMDLGLVDLVVILEEMGRVPAPGPFFSSGVAASLAAVRLGALDLQERLAGGARGTVSFEEPGGGFQVTASPGGGDSWVLDGTRPLVIDGATADFAIIGARLADGSQAAFVVDDPAGLPVPALDVARKAAHLALSGRPARRIGPDGDQTAVLARINDDIAVALCAETVGASERALQMAIEYSKQRVQFDRPIGSFQAIRHKIVDMLHQVELARVGTHWAAWTSQVDDPLREQAAAACKSFVHEAANMVTAENIQVHGGIGFTWDLDCHLLFRRVKQNDVLFGSQSWQRRRLADLVLGPA